jgi:hypothetical protein
LLRAYNILRRCLPAKPLSASLHDFLPVYFLAASLHVYCPIRSLPRANTVHAGVRRSQLSSRVIDIPLPSRPVKEHDFSTVSTVFSLFRSGNRGFVSIYFRLRKTRTVHFSMTYVRVFLTVLKSRVRPFTDRGISRYYPLSAVRHPISACRHTLAFGG